MENLDKYAGNWDTIASDVVMSNAKLKPFTPFSRYDALVVQVRNAAQGMDEDGLRKLAEGWIGKQALHNSRLPVIEPHLLVDESVSAAAAYIVALYLGDKDLRTQAFHRFFETEPKYAHDLAATVRDLDGLHFTSYELAGPSGSGRAWHTAVEQRFEDVIRKQAEHFEPKTIGIWMSVHNIDDFTWVMDSLDYTNPQRGQAIRARKEVA